MAREALGTMLPTPYIVEFEGRGYDITMETLPVPAFQLLKAAFLELVPPKRGLRVSELVLLHNGAEVDSYENLAADGRKYVLQLADHSPPTSDDAEKADILKQLSLANMRLADSEAVIRRLRADVSASDSSVRSHVAMFHKKKHLLIPAGMHRMIGDAPVSLEEHVTTMWNKLKQAPPASNKEADHQAVTEKVVAAIVAHLGNAASMTYIAKPQLGTIPDIGLFARNSTAPTWKSVVVPWKIETWNGKDINEHYNEGMGQTMSYMSTVFQATRQASVVGVFSNSWKIEIFRHELRGTEDEVMHTTGTLDFLSNSPVPTLGFKALVHLLLMVPNQLGHRPAFVELSDGVHLPLGDLLGSGGWSHVFKATISDKLVAVKVPNDAEPLHTDFVVLSQLNGEGCPRSIPKLLPGAHADALVTSPVGVPLKDFIISFGEGAPHRKLTQEQAGCIMAGVIVALRWAHEKGWVHLDIRRENIIVVSPIDVRTPQPLVVDWADAMVLGKKGEGMRGHRLTAAKELVRAANPVDKRSWYARASMDWESAMYLHAWLLLGGDAAWLWAANDDEMISKRDQQVSALSGDTVMQQLQALLADAIAHERI
jgi:hypothetical protein